MNILVTGSNGFIGKHVINVLKKANYNVFSYDLNNSEEELVSCLKTANFIIHLAGVNRPKNNEEYYEGNTNFTKHIVDILISLNKNTPIIFSSSIQASLDNDYGKSKKYAEDYLFNSHLPVYVFRLANVFGKWGKPNYNSALSTFCYNISHNLPIEIRDKEYVVTYNYIDDIVDAFIKCIEGDKKGNKEILYINPTYKCSLGNLADTLYRFKNDIESDRHIPFINNEFEYKLFITFCDYMSDDGYAFNYSEDDRGSFEEIYKSKRYGQISINKAYPNITKGNHYHKYKKEIFMTIKGECLIKERNIVNNEILKYKVNGNNQTRINMIPMYTHNIKNIGNDISITLMWISHIYDEQTSDTYKEDV